MKLFNDASYKGIHAALDGSFKRHAVLTGNLANANTPKYRARDFDFQNQLEQAVSGNKDDELKTTHPSHMDLSSESMSRVVYDNLSTVKADGNNVDLDKTMGDISENARLYNGAATLLSMKMRILRRIATSGGGGM